MHLKFLHKLENLIHKNKVSVYIDVQNASFNDFPEILSRYLGLCSLSLFVGSWKHIQRNNINAAF